MEPAIIEQLKGRFPDLSKRLETHETERCLVRTGVHSGPDGAVVQARAAPKGGI